MTDYNKLNFHKAITSLKMTVETEYFVIASHIYLSQHPAQPEHCNSILIILAPTRLDIRWGGKK